MANSERAIGRRWAGLLSLLTGWFCLGLPVVGATQLSLTSEHPQQGETIEVTVVGGGTAGEAQPAVEFNGAQYRLFPAPSGDGSGSPVPGDAPPDSPTLKTLIAVPADLAIGTYTLTCGRLKRTVSVTSGHYPVQRLRLPKARAELQPGPGEQEAVDGAKKIQSPERLWDGQFRVPCQARVSAGYGIRRVVNGKLLKDYFHSGIDYAGGLGASVRAPADGRVMLASTGFRLHGNTISLDHGQGVVTFYIHLQKILVKHGQLVKAGDLIGKVGQSGRANGPHLHFSLYVNQVAANPVYWYRRAF